MFRGRADEVFLRHFIFGLPSSQPFERVPGHDLWHVEMELPERSRIEYKIERVWHGRREWIMDPLNPRVAHDPYGANSVCHGVGYETPDWTHHDPEARPGALQPVSLSSQVFGGPRDLQVYIPARFRRSSRYPLLIVHDGPDYLRFAELKVVLDNLIHRLEIPPLVAALIHSPDRLVEYAADTRHATFLRDELVPALEQRYPLIARPEARALVGASFGGVAALHAAWTHPGYFGRLLLQSGSFAFSDIGDHGRPPVFDPVAGRVRQRFSRAARPTHGEGVRQLRHLRVADLREPLAGAAAAVDRHGGALRRGAGRPQLGELARPAARGAVVALPRPALDGLRMTRERLLDSAMAVH